MDRLIGRQNEQRKLSYHIDQVNQGKGGILLIAGEAGVGKTHLIQTAFNQTKTRILRGRTLEVSPAPFGPITHLLRISLESNPDAFSGCNSFLPHLALLLPELGKQQEADNQQTLFAALLCAFRSLAKGEPTILLVDDLQWADHATLSFVPTLAETTQHIPLLLLGVYRSDEIPRGHPLRRMRHELRRLGLLGEVIVEPFGEEELIQMAKEILGTKPSTQLTGILLDRTQGIPLFLEEFLFALKASNNLVHTSQGLRLDVEKEFPLPESIRDAVTLRLDSLSEQAQRLLEVAAVAGVHFDVEMVTSIAGSEEELEELVERHLITEISSPQAAFRHALVREAIYKNITWTRRRQLHREIAASLEISHGPWAVLAEHWLAGRELARALHAFVMAVRKSCALHAYRDAASAASHALEHWPAGWEENRRLDVLDQLGLCAQLSGMLSDAERAWREVVEGRQQAGDLLACAHTQRKLASVYCLQGAWGLSVAARRKSADAFNACDLPAEAATERLETCAHLHGAGHYTEAMQLLPAILADAEQAARHDLLARAFGLKGALHAKLGDIGSGLAQTRKGLALALDQNLIGPASEVYQRLASVYEQAADYPGAKEAYQSAVTFCGQQGVSAMEQVCIACLAVVLHQTGEWKEGVSLAESVMATACAPPAAKLIASSVLGLILACQGQMRQARRLLSDSLSATRAHEIFGLEILCTWGLSLVSEAQDDEESAISYCQALLERWEQTEERHYVIAPLRWAATLFGGRKESKAIAVCASSFSKIASATGNREALAGLAHTLGEAALAGDQPAQAIEHFEHSLALLSPGEAPFEYAQTQMRYGIALLRAGSHEQGTHQLIEAHRAARKLGARPLAARISTVLSEIGEHVDERVGQRVREENKRGGLTRRQHEIVRLIAQGLTNTEIAAHLTLSIRTVDMHVSNLLTRLDCRSRAEAVRRAAELHLLEGKYSRSAKKIP